VRALLALVLLAAAAQAEEPPPVALEEAREQFARGQEAFQRGRYEEALIAFERAYEIAQLPTLLPDIATCEEKLGQLQPAIDMLERYLASSDVKDRPAIEARVQALKAQLAPPPAPPPPVAAPPPVESSRVPRLRKAVVAIGISTGILALTAGALSIGAASKYHDLAGENPLDRTRDQASALGRLDAAADAMWAIAGASAIVTVTLHLVLRHERKKLSLSLASGR